MSNGYDHSTLEGYLGNYLRWFLLLALILGAIGGIAFLAAKPTVPAQTAQMQGQSPNQGPHQASNPAR
jgi:hypothetical protein